MPGRRRGFDVPEPVDRPADPAVRRANLRRIVRLFRPYRLRLAGVLALILFSSAVGVIPAFLLERIFDEALPERDLSLLNALVAGMVAIAIFTGVLGVIQTLLSNQVGQRVMHDLRTSVYKHLQRLSLAFFALALLPVFVWMTKRVGSARKKVAAVRQESMADISSLVQESLSVSGILLGKTMGRGPQLARRFEEESERLADL